MIDKADTYCGKCIKADVCGMEGVYDPATTYCAYRVEERPHGEWIYNQYDGNKNIGNWHCSECRYIVFGGYSQKPYYNFCPNCGADMREGDPDDRRRD